MTWLFVALAILFVTPALSRGPTCRRLHAAMRDVLPCVYMMASRYLGTLYTGVSSNLLGRVVQHRDGTFEGFTSRYDVTRLVWYEAADTMEAAILAEKRIKRWKRDWKIALIERDNPRWDDLAVALGLSPLPSL